MLILYISKSITTSIQSEVVYEDTRVHPFISYILYYGGFVSSIFVKGYLRSGATVLLGLVRGGSIFMFLEELD